MSGNCVHIVFASDNLYIKYTAVTLASMLSSWHSSRPLVVHILTAERLSDDVLKEIRSLGNMLPEGTEFEVQNHTVNANSFADIKTTPGISIATYFRLVMHNVLSKDIPRVLYLDSDIIVRKSLVEIFEAEMGDAIFAGVEDSLGRRYAQSFGTPDKYLHINAGVTLINLEKVRQIPFSSMIDDYLKTHRYLITLGDQQIINSVFAQDIIGLPVQWNVHGSMCDAQWRQKHAGVSNGFTENELASAAEDPAIIHYTFKRKPWSSLEHPWAQEWWHYAQKTSFFTKDEVQALVASQAASGRGVSSPAKKGFSVRVILGYLKSLRSLRTTRLAVEKLTSSQCSNKKTSSSLVPYYLLEVQSALLLKAIGERADNQVFSAHEMLQQLPEGEKFLSNGEPRDLAGGFHENLKTLLRTTEIGRYIDLSETRTVVVMVQRLRSDFYWKVLYAAFSYGKDILFVETTFFGALAPYVDQKSPLLLRKCFGYILDNRGYYFDARNPSSLETFLNSKDAILSPSESERSSRLIHRIIAEGLTKYNYMSGMAQSFSEGEECPFGLPSGSVLIIDQKKGDASIEAAAATAKTFELMVQAAISENPHAPIFLKPHPDNLGKVEGALFAQRVQLVPDGVHLPTLLDQCEKVYVVSSQVGFEALLRNKEVHVFGMPFYAGWGLTVDRQLIPRRTRRCTVNELFHAACLRFSVYLNPEKGEIVSMEEALDWMQTVIALAPKRDD